MKEQRDDRRGLLQECVIKSFIMKGANFHTHRPLYQVQKG